MAADRARARAGPRQAPPAGDGGPARHWRGHWRGHWRAEFTPGWADLAEDLARWTYQATTLGTLACAEIPKIAAALEAYAIE